GRGYRRGLTVGDHVARSLDALIGALAKAKPGEVVFVPGDVAIDCTARCLIEDLVLVVPAGVTLASDRGHEGSQGALIFSDHLATRPLIRAGGADVRISGLRGRGPDPERRLDHHRRAYRGTTKRDPDYYYRLPTSDGIETTHPRLEVDDCELAGWSHAAVYLRRGEGHRVHHCFIHHNQRQGLGYGVCHDVAASLIERNLFDRNRHSIAGTGRPGCGYEARHNVERGTSLSHCFDMHGGRDRKDGTNVAGTWMKVTHNAFFCKKTALVVRGVPQREALFRDNWCVHDGARRAVRGEKRTRVEHNAYGRSSPRVR
ncbi:MAG: hypothetical protein CMJ83_07015, partial [Planctomycetes bacterium]|nr:hypothetical protein [Planctomycetota bacterium]